MPGVRDRSGGGLRAGSFPRPTWSGRAWRELNLETRAPALDPAVLDELDRLSDGGDLVNEVAELFIADALMQLALVGDWLAGGDRDAVRRAAHRLKGSSASLGANEFARLCSQLADTGDLPDRSTTELLAAIRSELDRIWRALEQRNAHR